MMAGSNVEIDCLSMDCRWNDNAKCGAGNILVQQGGTCMSYEPLGMPGDPMGAGMGGMMGADPGMGPGPGAGAAPSPDLMALLAGGGM